MNAKEELILQIRKQRARLSKELEERADMLEKGHVPYDKKNARNAVSRFLEDHPDRQAIADRLNEMLKDCS